MFFTADDAYKFVEGIGGREGLFSSTDIYILGAFKLMVDYCIEGDGGCEQILVNTLDDKIPGQQKAKAFPNPIRNTITIKLPDNQYYFDCSIEIFNAVGQFQLGRRLVEKDNTIDMSSFPSGVYFYKILTGVDQLDVGSIIKR